MSVVRHSPPEVIELHVLYRKLDKDINYSDKKDKIEDEQRVIELNKIIRDKYYITTVNEVNKKMEEETQIKQEAATAAETPKQKLKRLTADYKIVRDKYAEILAELKANVAEKQARRAEIKALRAEIKGE